MLKAYIVTKYTSFKNLVTLEDGVLLTFDESLSKVLMLGRDPEFLVSNEVIDDPRNMTLVNFQEGSDDFHKLEVGLLTLQKKGFKIIDVLLEDIPDFEYLYAVLALFRRYPSLRIFAKIKDKTFTIYEEGSYLINRNDAPIITMYPLTETVKFSLDHVQTKIVQQTISQKKGPLIHTNYLQGRVAVLHIKKGAVTFVQTKEDPHA